MKGHLQIFHAFLPDPNEPAELTPLPTTSSESQEPEPGWELVDGPETTNNLNNGQVEQPARVQNCNILFYKDQNYCFFNSPFSFNQICLLLLPIQHNRARYHQVGKNVKMLMAVPTTSIT